jgi:hypothetical protein
MGAKYAELAEFTRTGREKLEAEGINLNVAALLSVHFRLGISIQALDVYAEGNAKAGANVYAMANKDKAEK